MLKIGHPSVVSTLGLRGPEVAVAISSGAFGEYADKTNAEGTLEQNQASDTPLLNMTSWRATSGQLMEQLLTRMIITGEMVASVIISHRTCMFLRSPHFRILHSLTSCGNDKQTRIVSQSAPSKILGTSLVMWFQMICVGRTCFQVLSPRPQAVYKRIDRTLDPNSRDHKTRFNMA